ncbi:MAG: 16S rRNA (adenine(1518)-N(6)/adenine(1519)-N(6))-dimethyltransferase RsmA, partial [Phototrophicaceae bacterium]
MFHSPRTLMEKYGLDPKKSLGQNFFQDSGLLHKIAALAKVPAGETIVEIGAGTGVLTRELAAMYPQSHIFAVELDQRLAPILNGELAEFDNVEVIYNDILAVDVGALVNGQPYSVVANVPYYVSSAILKHLLQDSSLRPTRLMITLQLELAERICATPNDASLLSVSVQLYGTPSIPLRLNAAAFWPRPEINSAVLQVDVAPQPLVDIPDERTFFRVVKAGFSQKRKQLKNALNGGLGIGAEAVSAILSEANVEATRRAETLQLPEWAAIARSFKAVT